MPFATTRSCSHTKVTTTLKDVLSILEGHVSLGAILHHPLHVGTLDDNDVTWDQWKGSSILSDKVREDASIDGRSVTVTVYTEGGIIGYDSLVNDTVINSINVSLGM